MIIQYCRLQGHILVVFFQPLTARDVAIWNLWHLWTHVNCQGTVRVQWLCSLKLLLTVLLFSHTCICNHVCYLMIAPIVFIDLVVSVLPLLVQWMGEVKLWYYYVLLLVRLVNNNMVNGVHVYSLITLPLVYIGD